MFVVLVVAGPWMINTLMDYTIRLFWHFYCYRLKAVAAVFPAAHHLSMRKSLPCSANICGHIPHSWFFMAEPLFQFARHFHVAPR